MEKMISNGGPAFPKPHTVADANHKGFKIGCDGMSLRDYFAAKAMQGLLDYCLKCGHEKELANAAYEMADAMLLEREKKIK